MELERVAHHSSSYQPQGYGSSEFGSLDGRRVRRIANDEIECSVVFFVVGVFVFGIGGIISMNCNTWKCPQEDRAFAHIFLAAGSALIALSMCCAGCRQIDDHET